MHNILADFEGPPKWLLAVRVTQQEPCGKKFLMD